MGKIRLAERVGDQALVAVVAPHTQSADLDLAQSAIRCLAHLGSEDAARVLVATLMSAKKFDHAVVCAQALGQIGDPVAVEALAGLLLQKKSWFRDWKWDDQARTTAGAPPPEPVLRASSANRVRLARHPPTRGRPTLPDPPGGSLGPA